ncbi:hypothetical protein CI610_00067 [invertebrate metagenome]|uniref:SnoaL-like domain-containing protein n=1 Tax=invertebrate metagenome TaxID=1711999 RepID=A0A2H9TCK2_9ZZZZ
MRLSILIIPAIGFLLISLFLFHEKGQQQQTDAFSQNGITHLMDTVDTAIDQKNLKTLKQFFMPATQLIYVLPKGIQHTTRFSNASQRLLTYGSHGKFHNIEKIHEAIVISPDKQIATVFQKRRESWCNSSSQDCYFLVSLLEMRWQLIHNEPKVVERNRKILNQHIVFSHKNHPHSITAQNSPMPHKILPLK